jgi:hypothetical protein
MTTGNEKKTLDYGAFLADLERKRSVLEQAIASVRAVMASGALLVNAGDSMPAIADNATAVLHGGEVPAGAFHGMKIPAAAKLYLSIVNKKQTTKEIADGLRDGGMETAGKNFEIIVGSALYRISRDTNREIVRLKDGWGLAAWWPSGVRTSQEKPNGRKAKKTRKARLSKVAQSVAPQSVAENNVHTMSTQEQIADLLRSNPMKVYTPQEVSQELGMKTQAVAPTLGRLVSSNVVEKIESGKYRAAHS